MNQKFYIKTFGCQMNVADSERMAALLGGLGMVPAEQIEDANVIIINGCSVREKAVHKAVSSLGELQLLKRDTSRAGGAPIIGMGGCVGQLDRQTLFKRAPYLDFVFGTDTIDNLPEIIHRVKNGERHVLYTDFDQSMDYSTETKIYTASAQAYVNIMKGCDKYCTYCIVPYTRGREKSRTIDEVVTDIARLVASGVREITLLGQNVNSFGKGNPSREGREPRTLHNVIGKVGPKEGEENFPQLLRAIDSDPRCAALKRIRFTSSHPLNFSEELLDCYAPVSQGGVARLASQLHLPVQSGSNAVLQKMGRHHKIETYLAQMARVRELRPDIGLSTDLIVGFPTETDEDFKATLELLDRVQYDHVYAFAYSPRPGTRAAKMPDDVPDSVKNERLNILLKHQMEISRKRYAGLMGKRMEILVEGEAKNQNLVTGGAARQSRAHHEEGDEAANAEAPTPLARDRVWTGRTSCFRIVNFLMTATEAPTENLTGKFVEVEITGSTSLSLQGKWIREAGVK